MTDSTSPSSHAAPGSAQGSEEGYRAPDELVAPIAESLLTEIAAVRRPLDAELALCHVFAIVDRGIHGDAHEREMALTTLLEQVLENAENLGTERALALVRTCASLGPERSRAAARAAAERMTGAGVRAPSWIETIGRPTPLRAWRYADLLGEQESLGVLFSYRGRDHALTVLVDHPLGGGLKDVWVAEGRKATGLHDVVRAGIVADPELTFADVDMAVAAECLRRALSHPVVPVDDDQVEDVAGMLYLARSRSEHLGAIVAGS